MAEGDGRTASIDVSVSSLHFGVGFFQESEPDFSRGTSAAKRLDRVVRVLGEDVVIYENPFPDSVVVEPDCEDSLLVDCLLPEESFDERGMVAPEGDHCRDEETVSDGSLGHHLQRDPLIPTEESQSHHLS